MRGLVNNFKTTLLMGSLMGLCLGVGYLIGGPHAMIYAFVFGGMMNLIAFFFSDKIALATMRAQQIGPDEDPVLWGLVEQLSRRAGLPMPRVFVSPAAAPNAFATGRSPRYSAVCVTAGLRQMLSDAELQGVLAHELAHIKNRDVLIGTIAAIMAGAITLLGRLAFFTGGSNDRRGNPLIAILMMILAPIAAVIIQMAISRSREYEADRLGAVLAQDARGLARSLQKLEAANRRIPLPVPETQSSLFIVQPLTGGFGKLFSTHPPTEERIARLLEMERSF
ncbi:MAG TPA: zinc metalloprotease HtpX [Sedimentisphaerales bacterium]|nr:zinc metalloprotease HtpX [Sedimentisphaerales bacterium]